MSKLTVIENIKAQMSDLIDEAFNAGTEAERDRILGALGGGTVTVKPTTVSFTSRLREAHEPTITRLTRRVKGTGKASYEASVAYVQKQPKGGIVRTKDLMRLPPKVSTFTTYNVIQKMLKEGSLLATGRRGYYSVP